MSELTDNTNLIKEALEAAIEEYMGALRGKLQKAYREQIGLKLEKAEAALALIEKSDVMWELPDEIMFFDGCKVISPVKEADHNKPVLVIPLEQS